MKGMVFITKKNEQTNPNLSNYIITREFSGKTIKEILIEKIHKNR